MRKNGILIGFTAAIGSAATAGCIETSHQIGSYGHIGSALSFTLEGDGRTLALHDAPAAPGRNASYPLQGFTKMNVRVNPAGDLSATCENTSGKVDCPEIPFFSRVERTPSGFNHVDVYDIYGYKVVDHTCDENDTPSPLPPSASPSDGGTCASQGADGSTCSTGPGTANTGSASSGGSSDTNAGDGGAGYSTGSGGYTNGSGNDNKGGSGSGYSSGGGGSKWSDCGLDVKADCGGCTLTVGTQTCDCSDPSCVKDAISTCAASGATGGGYQAGGGASDGSGDGSGGSGTIGGGGQSDGGSAVSGSGGGATGGNCDPSTYDNAKTQFCADIDAWLKDHNITQPIDCSKVTDMRYVVANPPAKHDDYRCRDIIHDGWIKVRATLAACNPDGYINWESSSRWELLQQGDCRGSPLVLDLDDDGVRLSALEDGVAFDLLGSGEKVKTAWTRGGDALLAIDWNHDGTIDGASELFGNGTFGEAHDDGFRALAELDANADGRIDAKDPSFAELVVWRDADRDGISRASEMLPLRDVGVRAIDVVPTRTSGPSSWDANGNDLSLVGRFVRDDGRAGLVVDAYLRFKPMR